MPVITIAMHPVPDDTKKALISTVTRSAAEVANVPESAFIVLVNELPEESIGIGGRTLKEIKAAPSA